VRKHALILSTLMPTPLRRSILVLVCDFRLLIAGAGKYSCFPILLECRLASCGLPPTVCSQYSCTADLFDGQPSALIRRRVVVLLTHPERKTTG